MSNEAKYQQAPTDETVYSPTSLEVAEEPPKYDSLFSQLKAAKEETSGPVAFLGKSAAILGGSKWLSGFLIPSLALHIAMIVIGVLKKDNCPLEKFIPIWLIVFGSTTTFTTLVQLLISIVSCIKQRKNPNYVTKTKFTCINNIISLFLFAWFIAGNVWVYKNWNVVSYDDSQPDKYCDKLCYLFSFSVITITWGFLLCFCVSCCLICCFGFGAACCVACKVNK